MSSVIPYIEENKTPDISNYKEWKKLRKIRIEKVGSTLLQMNQKELLDAFDQIENGLNKKNKSRNIKHQFSFLMGISLLYHFQRNLEVIRRYHQDIVNLLDVNSENVVRTVATVLNIIAKDNPEGIQLLKEPTSRAMKKFTFNYFYILKKSCKFAEFDSIIAEKLQAEHEKITYLAEKNELPQRNVCMKLINYSIRIGTDEFVEKIVESNIDIEKCSSSELHTKVLILSAVFELRRPFLENKFAKLTKDLINAAENENGKVEAADSLKLCAEIYKHDPAAKYVDLQRVINVLSGIFDKFNYAALFRDVFADFVDLLADSGSNIDIVIEVIEKLATKESLEFQKLSFSILAKLIRRNNQIKFNHSIFTTADICDEAIDCLLLLPNLDSDVTKSLIAPVFDNLNTQSSFFDQMQSLKLARVFRHQLFPKRGDLLKLASAMAVQRNSDVQLEAIRTASLDESPQTEDFLLQHALLGDSVIVRTSSLRLLFPTESLSVHPLIHQILFNGPHEAKIAAIELVSQLLKWNPLELGCSLRHLVSDLFAAISSYNNIKSASSAAELLSLVAKLAPSSVSTQSEDFFLACLAGISPQLEPASVLNNTYAQTVKSFCRPIPEISRDDFAFVRLVSQMKRTRHELFSFLNQPLIDLRDGFLLDAASCFPFHLRSHLDIVLRIIHKLVEKRRNVTLLQKAISALSVVHRSVGDGLNLRLYYPQLIPALTTLMNRSSPALSSSVASLLGLCVDTFGDSLQRRLSFSSLRLGVDLQNPSFFTDFTLSLLTGYFDRGGFELLDVFPPIFKAEPTNSAKFVCRIVPLFKALSKRNTYTKQRLQIFGQLQQVVSSCPTECLQFLAELTTELCSNLREKECLSLLTCLSFTYGTAFIPICRVPYLECLQQLSTSTNDIFPALFKFAAFCVVLQGQSLSQLLDSLDKIDRSIIRSNSSLISHYLTLIVQSCDVERHSTRIGLFILNLSTFNVTSEEISQLASSLVSKSGDSAHFIAKMLDSSKISCSCPIKRISPEYSPSSVSIPSSYLSIDSIFQDVSLSTLEQFYLRLISNSPSAAIRSCSSFANTHKLFLTAVLPVAFLSCWQMASPKARKNFSIFVAGLFEKGDVDQTLIAFAEIADRAFSPLSIPPELIAKACSSKTLSLYFMQRAHFDNPNNAEIVDSLLQLLASMGRNSSAQGLLAQTRAGRELEWIARWNEILSNWENALSLYTDSNLASLVRCHAHLQQWDSIVNLWPKFTSLPDSGKERVARYFGWAFFMVGDVDRCKNVQQFVKGRSASDLVFLAVAALREGYTDRVRRIVAEGLSLVAGQGFSGDDADRAESALSAAQLFMEIQEAAELWDKNRQSSTGIGTNIATNACFGANTGSNAFPSSPNERFWSKRLTSFLRRSDTWMKLLEIRSLVSSPDSYPGVYRQILSAARSERRWNIVENICKRIDNLRPPIPTDLVIARAKAESDLGKCSNAISMLESALKTAPPSQSHTVSRHLADQLMIADHRHHLHRAISLYKSAADGDNSDVKAWAGWAYANLAAVDENDADKHVLNAVEGFLNAVNLSGERTTEFLIVLFAAFFKVSHSEKISHNLLDRIAKLSTDILVRIVPQLAVQIAHPDSTIRGVVRKILLRIGKTRLQSVVFPLVLYKASGGEKSQIAAEMMSSLSSEHPDAVYDAELFVQGMVDAALTPYERWSLKMNAAARAMNRNDEETYRRLLRSALNEHSGEARSDIERRFRREYGAGISRVNALFESGADQKSIWPLLRDIYDSCEKTIKQLENVSLPKVNPALAAKRDFAINVPNSAQRVLYVEPYLQVLPTQQHPRIVFIVSVSGERVKFLLKGEDLRLDQRVMQFLSLVNSLLRHGSFSRSAFIVEYAVVPLSPTAGLISWVQNADTMNQIISDIRSAKGVDNTPEFEAIERATMQNHEKLSYIQYLEAFEEMMKNEKCKATELRDYLWYKAQNAYDWVDSQDNFCATTALMSMTGYVIGLGDRHPGNIMLQRDTGKVIHIDFSDIFERTMNRKNYPERVQFRLTRMIVNALDGGYVEGMFTQMCKSALQILRQNKSSLVALLEIFIHEPIGDEQMSDSDGKMPATKAIERVTEKLSGTDGVEKGKDPLEVSDQVNKLIEEASDYRIYILHYSGWCAIW